MSRLYRCIVRQDGIFLALAAIVSVVVVAAFLTLAIENAIVRKASLKLRATVDNICLNLAASREMPLHDPVVNLFVQRIQNLPPIGPGNRVVYTSARVIMPTMPDAGATFSTTDVNCDLVPVPPAVSSSPPIINEICGTPISSCTVSGDHFAPGFECLFQGTVDWSSDPVCNPNQYPGSLWTNYDAGVVVGCELEADVDLRGINPFRPRTEQISARSVAWIPVVGPSQDYRPCGLNNAGRTSQLATSPGLTIAVSTHLTTNASDARFRFSGGLASFDPLDQFPLPTPNVTPNIPNFSHLPIPTAGSSEQIPVKLSATRRSEKFPFPPMTPTATPDPGSGQNYDKLGDWDPDPAVAGTARNPGASPPIYSDHEEMLVACMNPVVLVRNLFLTALVELAARHGQLRSATEILHVGTQHRNLDNTLAAPMGNGLPAADPHSIAMNGPTYIVPFGQDLLVPQYRLPTVYYFSGDATHLPPNELGPHKNGWINPYPGHNWAHHHALIANQLRYCFHLYRGSATKPGIDKAGPGFYTTADPPPPPYEPDLYNERQVLEATEGNEWGQASNADLLPATEVVAALGSTQTCPYLQQLPTGVCAKPASSGSAAIGTYDLRPDVAGLFHYLYAISGSNLVPSQQLDNNNLVSVVTAVDAAAPVDPVAAANPTIPVATATPTPTGTFEAEPTATPSPTPTGTIPPTPTPPPAFGYPDGATAGGATWHQAANLNTAIIYVTHQRLNSQAYDEVDRLDVLTGEGVRRNAGRPLVVVYIPAEGFGVTEGTVVQNFRDAFNIEPPPIDSVAESVRQFIMLSPYRPVPAGEQTWAEIHAAECSTEADCFSAYWAELLNPASGDNYIVNIARNVFNLIVMPQRKL